MDDLETLLDGRRNLSDEIATLMDRYTGRAGLEDFCQDGGAVHDVEVSISLDPYDEDSGLILGSYDISFYERYSSGCRDIEWSNRFSGSGSLELRVATGEVFLETEAELVRDRGEEEREEEGSDEKGFSPF